ncbi:hypothetical protein [Actomonas aquatica]|uniref:Uncharacterized protein n=1 Tax=Actomonas aquatica TaxID=2866162 RepID=A0ABZ1C868_9BACT|nr:hypothetical protein [Opitutus sp. WL0086]WRQ87663.1 hypothetical protein K1X11_022850 [Opitutus sp. WL0086]
MNKSYIIVPILLMVGFGFIYKKAAHDIELVEQQEQAELDAKAAEEAAIKAEAERQAKEDAERRTAEREADEAAKEAKKRADWEARGIEIAEATAEANAEADKLAEQAAELELKLRATRNERDAQAGEAFDLAKKVELARIAKRNAELEIQRMTAMVTKRAEESTLTEMPELAAQPSR